MADLTPAVQQSFQIAKSFSQNEKQINGISFSPNGDALVTSSDDDSINLYNCLSGSHVATKPSKKYGCNLITYTHADNTVLFASTKVDHKVMYMSLHDNKFLRYFMGHKEKITSIRMNPISDTFMTCSRDKTIRIWDVKSDKCQAQIPSSEVAVADYDCSGIVFGTGCAGTDVRLYDSRAFDKGPFLRKVLQFANPQGEIMDLKFSGDGQHVVALMSDNVAHLLDAYDLETKHRFGSGQGSVSEEVNTVCFSPCGQYLYGGTPEGRILVWNVQTGQSVADLGGHSDQVNSVVFNPKKMLFASACTSLSMWLPSI